MDGDMSLFPHEWLKDKLGGGYEVPLNMSKQAIEMLQKLQEINVGADTDADQLIMYIGKMIEQIKSEDEKVQSILKKLGISVPDLGEAANKALNEVVDYQLKHNLRDLDKTTVVLDRVERMQTDAERNSLMAHLSREQERIIFMTNRLKNVTSQLKSKREEQEESTNSLLQEVEKKMLETEEMESVIEKLKLELHELDMQLKIQTGCCSDLPKEVLRGLKNIDAIKAEITEIQTQLKEYKDLPPHFSEARRKLSEAFAKLYEVEKEVADAILGKD